MAQQSSLIKSLKALMPESSWPWVIPALMNDAIIWEALHENQFLEKMVESFPNPEDWSPANLALIELGCTTLDSIDDGLYEKARNLTERYIDDETPLNNGVLNLEEGAFIAIGLLDRAESENWQDVSGVINSSMNGSSGWLTPGAILFGMAADQTALIDSFLSLNPPTRIIPLIIHMILSQPMPLGEVKKLLAHVLEDLGLANTVRILVELKQCRPELATSLTNEWLENHPLSTSEVSESGISDQLTQITNYLLSAELYSLAGRVKNATQSRMWAVDNLNVIHSQISNQLVEDSLQAKNPEHSLMTWTRALITPEFSPPAGLIVQLLHAGRIEDSLTLLTENEGSSQTPLHWLNNIYQALDQEDINQARLFAHQTLNSFIESNESDPVSNVKVFGSQQEMISFLIELINLLSDLALYKESLQAAQLANSIKRHDPRLLMKLATSSRAVGEFDISIQAAEHAIALDPQNPEFRRQLAMSLEHSGQWTASLPERQAIIDHRFAQPDLPAWPTSDDLLALAYCSLHANKSQEAFEVCQKAIKLDPSNGHAHAILGEALSALGQESQAMEHFSLATQLAPHKSESWLSLSNANISAGKRDKAIETLRTASHAVPDDPAIFYALGQIHLEDDSLTQAHTAIGKAYKLVSQPTLVNSSAGTTDDHDKGVDRFTHARKQHCEIAITYGDILNNLGHPDQAINVYENAYQAYPSYPGLAYVYASALLDAGNESAALAPLTIAVAAKPDNPKPYLDYARSLLTAKIHPENAVQALEEALLIIDNLHEGEEQLNPSNDLEIDISEMREMGIALLAQSQAASGALEKSLNTYSQALETDLAKDEEWKSELAIGMGRVALELEQPEIAIAALKEISQDEIQDTSVAQILTEAYAAICLTQEALFTARTAVHLAPDDVEILSWFADKATELGVESEAVPALTSAAQLDPQRTDLVIQLGKVLTKIGKTKSAREAYLSALSSSYASPEDLYQAADGLSDLGDNESAANCLERALELQPHPPLTLILNLANAYESANKYELAVKTIDKGIDIDSENVHLHSFKADLLRKLGRHDAARACLEHALILHPDDTQINLRMAELLREQGDLHNAFSHAVKIVDNSAQEPDSTLYLVARGITADLARATLQDSYSRELLQDITLKNVSISDELTTKFSSSLTSLFCLYAEIALEREEQISAATALNDAYTLEPNHPRVLALQSRMALRQGDLSAAFELFNDAVEHIQDEDNEANKHLFSPSTFLGIALAGIDLHEWDLALEILKNRLSVSTKESILHLQIARIYVLRAEFQRLCQLSDIVGHNPGARTLSPSTFRLFEGAIQETINSLSNDQQVEIPAAVTRWRNRGLVVFQPNQKHIQALESIPLEPSDQASLLAAHAFSEDLPEVAKLFHALTNEVDLQKIDYRILLIYALSVCLYSPDEIGVERALDAINAAIELKPTEANSYWIRAKLAEIMDDPDMAKSAIENALSLWPNEPRWQAYAAYIAQQTDDHAEVINHLENAVSLEPTYIPHYLALGKAHLNSGQGANAIQVYEKAIQVAPDQVEVYLAQASAQCTQQKYKLAVQNAEKAIEIAPETVQPLLLRAEIAIKMDDHSQAMENVESALRLNPIQPAALYLQAVILEELGKTEQALSVIEKAIPISDDPLPLLLKKIQIQTDTLDLDSNIAELEELYDLYPDNPLVLAPYAHALAAADRNEESIQTAQKALHHRSNQLPIEDQAELHHLLGLQLKQTGQLDQSIHQLTESIRLAPKNIRSYLDLGLTQEERRQHSLALETYKKAISLYPSDPRPYYQAGLLLKASRDYPAAESMLRRAAERAPDDISIHRQLAGLVAINLIHSRQPAAQEI